MPPSPIHPPQYACKPDGQEHVCYGGRVVVYLQLSALVAASPRWVSMVIFTTEAQRPQRILCVCSSEARISFRVFRVVHGYIPGGVNIAGRHCVFAESEGPEIFE
jgi:hypothetical protein